MPGFKRAPDNYRRQAFGRNPAVEQWRIRGARRLPGAMDQACGPPGSGSGHAEYRHHRPVDRTGGFLVMARVREGLVPAYLLLCLILGGASAAGLWANMLLQLLAIPIILWSLLSRPETPLSPPARRLLLLAWLAVALVAVQLIPLRSEEHTSELQSLMRISYAVFCLKKK